MKKSETIAEFLNLLEECKTTHEWAYEQVGIEDKRQNDLLHAIEFTDDEAKLMEYAERLKKCRLDRRYYKDIEIITSIINWWGERNEIGLGYLRETLERVKEQETYCETRTYTPRVEEL